MVACRSKTAAPPPTTLGGAVSPYGSRSRYETSVRHVIQNTKVPLEEASSRTPLHDTYGIITPSSLHFERHHGGVPEIDPATHTLTIHGMVDRPLVFSVDELKRFPSASRIHFLECSGNSGGEWRGGSTETDVQRINRPLKACVFAVDFIHHDNDWLVKFVSIFPRQFSANFWPCNCINCD